MTNSDKGFQEYYNNRKQDGENDENIIKELINSGWDPEQARTAINNLARRSTPAPLKSRIKLIIIISLLVVLIAGFVIYWFVIRQPSDSSTDTPAQGVNAEAALPATNETDTIATVFGESIYRGEVEDIAQLFSASDTWDYGALSADYGGDNMETAALFLQIDSLVAKEAVRRLGVTPMTDDELAVYIDESMTEEYWQGYQEQYGVDSQYRSTLRSILINNLRQTELSNHVDEQLQPAFHDLLGKHVNAIYNAFNKRLQYLSEEDKDSLYYDFDSSTASDPLPDTDPNFLVNEGETLVKDLEMPEQLKNELLALEQTPNILTSVIDDGSYYYFGMVFTPKEFDYPPGFAKGDTMIVRFPWAVGKYAHLVRKMTWEDGYNNGDIKIFDAPGLELLPPERGVDFDGDGLYDYVEWAFGTKISEADSDSDGKTDKEEYDANTNPVSNN